VNFVHVLFCLTDLFSELPVLRIDSAFDGELCDSLFLTFDQLGTE
jgi:hypothetical protein